MKKLSKIALSVSLLGLGVNIVAPLSSNQVQVAFAADDSQYKAIFEEYTAKLRPEAERLAKEYVSEVVANQLNDAEKTKLAVNKLTELANIPVEGNVKMANLAVNVNTGEIDPLFTKWSNELINYYTKESQPIFDNFVESYANDGSILEINQETSSVETMKENNETKEPQTTIAPSKKEETNTKSENKITSSTPQETETTLQKNTTKPVAKTNVKALPKTSAVK